MTNLKVTALLGEELKDSLKALVESEPNNKHDSKAIKITTKGGKDIGYLANSTYALIEESLSAAEVGEKISDLSGFYIEIGDFKKKVGVRFAHEATILEKKEQGTEIKFVGAMATNPGKNDLFKELENKSKIPVEIKLEDDQLIGLYKGESFGKAKIDSEIERKEVLLKFLGNSKISARAISREGNGIICIIPEKAVKKAKITSSIEGEINRIISEKVLTEEELNERLVYMKANNVSERQQAKVLVSIKKMENKTTFGRIPNPKTKYKEMDGEFIVPDSISYFNQKLNLRFEGEKGCGKNVLAETLAWLYNVPLFEFSLNSQQSNNSLLGGKTFIAKEDDNNGLEELTEAFVKIFNSDKIELTEKEKEFFGGFLSKLKGNKEELEFELSPILEAFKYGGILVLDEYNTALPHVLTLFHSLLDERRRIDVTGLGLVEAHETFRCIATSNIDYEGTFNTNEATDNRFVPILFPITSSIKDILEEKFKKEIEDEEIDEEVIHLADTLFENLKLLAKNEDLSSQVITVRGYIFSINGILNDITPKRAFQRCVIDAIKDPEEREVGKGVLDTIFGV